MTENEPLCRACEEDVSVDGEPNKSPLAGEPPDEAITEQFLGACSLRARSQPPQRWPLCTIVT
jgi:hypothetical protein